LAEPDKYEDVEVYGDEVNVIELVVLRTELLEPCEVPAEEGHGVNDIDVVALRAELLPTAAGLVLACIAAHLAPSESIPQ
jgi:hypothetical protein